MEQIREGLIRTFCQASGIEIGDPRLERGEIDIEKDHKPV